MENATKLDPAKFGLNDQAPTMKDMHPRDRILVTVSAIIFALAVGTNIARFFYQNSQGSSAATYKPPSGFEIKSSQKTKSFEELPFIPKKINNTSFDPTLLESSAKKMYPELNGQSLIQYVNRDLFTWLTLKELLKKPTGPNTTSSIEQIETELATLKEDHKQNQLKASGFFIKTRYIGVYEKTDENNVQALIERNAITSKSELQTFAQRTITNYIEQAKDLADPVDIVERIQNDEIVQLLNNKELSRTFEDELFDPPFFDDPDFFTLIKTAPLNEFTPVTPLKTINLTNGKLEPYAYIAFYITKREGEYLPVNTLVMDYFSKASIQ